MEAPVVSPTVRVSGPGTAGEKNRPSFYWDSHRRQVRRGVAYCRKGLKKDLELLPHTPHQLLQKELLQQHQRSNVLTWVWRSSKNFFSSRSGRMKWKHQHSLLKNINTPISYIYKQLWEWAPKKEEKGPSLIQKREGICRVEAEIQERRNKFLPQQTNERRVVFNLAAKYTAYADDVSVLVTNNAGVVEVRKDIGRYDVVTGAKINHEKLVGLRLNSLKGFAISDYFSCRDGPCKILGVWFGPNLLLEKNWSEVLEKVVPATDLWLRTRLTLKGRTEVYGSHIFFWSFIDFQYFFSHAPSYSTWKESCSSLFE